MKYWDDFPTREDFETEPGVLDPEKIRAVRLNTYLKYIGDFIEMEGHELPNIAADQVEEFMVHDFTCYTHIIEGRNPEPDEISAYLRDPDNFEARKYWTYLCVHANKDNWPDLVKRIREEWNIPEEVEVNNDKEREQMNNKTIEETNWKFKEL